MALKDWRKVSEEKGFIQWYNKETRESAFVYYQTYIPELKKKNHWAFEVMERGNITKNEKFTKTKQQALKYAKSYMRKH